MQRMLC